MLRSLNGIRGYAVHARDGDVGKVSEFYFDDQTWNVRYLVVETGGWFSGKKVLISPASFSGPPDWKQQIFPVNLTMDEIKESPDIDADRPVSRQTEALLAEYYRWPVYWGAPGVLTLESPMPLGAVRIAEKGDPGLRSAKEVSGYSIEAAGGAIGEVEDFIADDEDWSIRYLVVDTGRWLPGKKVLVAAQWVSDISWTDQKIDVDLSSEIIRKSPPFDPSSAVNRRYEEVLYDYYGRPKYWV